MGHRSRTYREGAAGVSDAHDRQEMQQLDDAAGEQPGIEEPAAGQSSSEEEHASTTFFDVVDDDRTTSGEGRAESVREQPSDAAGPSADGDEDLLDATVVLRPVPDHASVGFDSDETTVLRPVVVDGPEELADGGVDDAEDEIEAFADRFFVEDDVTAIIDKVFGTVAEQSETFFDEPPVGADGSPAALAAGYDADGWVDDAPYSFGNNTGAWPAVQAEEPPDFQDLFHDGATAKINRAEVAFSIRNGFTARDKQAVIQTLPIMTAEEDAAVDASRSVWPLEFVEPVTDEPVPDADEHGLRVSVDQGVSPDLSALSRDVPSEHTDDGETALYRSDGGERDTVGYTLVFKSDGADYLSMRRSGKSDGRKGDTAEPPESNYSWGFPVVDPAQRGPSSEPDLEHETAREAAARIRREFDASSQPLPEPSAFVKDMLSGNHDAGFETFSSERDTFRGVLNNVQDRLQATFTKEYESISREDEQLETMREEAEARKRGAADENGEQNDGEGEAQSVEGESEHASARAHVRRPTRRKSRSAQKDVSALEPTPASKQSDAGRDSTDGETDSDVSDAGGSTSGRRSRGSIISSLVEGLLPRRHVEDGKPADSRTRTAKYEASERQMAPGGASRAEAPSTPASPPATAARTNPSQTGSIPVVRPAKRDDEHLESAGLAEAGDAQSAESAQAATPASSSGQQNTDGDVPVAAASGQESGAPGVVAERQGAAGTLRDSGAEQPQATEGNPGSTAGQPRVRRQSGARTPRRPTRRHARPVKPPATTRQTGAQDASAAHPVAAEQGAPRPEREDVATPSQVPVPAGISDASSSADDERFMHEAIEQAKQAEALDEVPVGAVVVCGGKVISSAFNRRETDQSPAAHAEALALQQASERLQRWRLSDCTVYVTLEPCIMCAGLMQQARIARCVFGAYDPKGGALGSLYNVADDARLNHRFEVTPGVCREECSSLMHDFFVRLRDRRRAATSEE